MAYTELQKRQHIRELQMFLHGISHTAPLPHLIPDGIYGVQTAEAVRQFQQQNHLPETGKADTETWNALAQAYLQDVRPPTMHLTPFPTGVSAYAPGIPAVRFSSFRGSCRHSVPPFRRFLR